MLSVQFVIVWSLFIRSQVHTETNRLTSLCQLWEVKVDDDAIPEESKSVLSTGTIVTVIL